MATTVEGVITLTNTMTADVNHKLEKFGANILIVPRSDNLTLSYGVMAIGGVAFDMQPMALEALEWVGLEKKSRRLPNQISGGEMERVAIARAIANNPPILLADEPTGNLDSGNSRIVMALLDRLNRQGMTVVMVLHSEACTAFARRVLYLQDGRLKEKIAPSEYEEEEIRAQVA